MTRLCLWFDGKQNVSLGEEPQKEPGPGEVLVRSLVSAISAGTEMLFYHGAVEEGSDVDGTINGYTQGVSWPLRYGYSTVGVVERAGAGVPGEARGRLVFGFVPHASSFTAPLTDLLEVPRGIEVEDAALFASAETAVNLVMDTAPLIGERVSVFGQGTIGLFTTALLARFPLASLTAWDLHPARREAAAALGASAADPLSTEPGADTEDAAVELSGTAEGYAMSVRSCGFAGRVILGSWYGAAARGRAMEAFGTSFHRKRLRIISSQVSTIAPGLSGRWTRERRRAAAGDAVRLVGPSRWITQRIPFSRAPEAYRLVAEEPGRTIQVVMTHPAPE